MKIVIGADLVPRESSEKYFVDGDVDTLFSDVLPIMQGADRTIVNLECALTRSDNAIKKFGPNLKADPDCAPALKKAGITDIALSNNHVFDFGVEGLCDTVDALKKAGLPYTGVGNDDQDSRTIYYMEQKGLKVAVVNVCEHEYTYATPNRMGANPFDPFITMQDIRTAKANSDYVIVLYHGGKEHCCYPSPRLLQLCREMVHNGAGTVLTQHSHCIGCYENYNGSHILYGQGNFHFTKTNAVSASGNDMWDTCLLTELDINPKTKKANIKFYPLRMNTLTLTLAKGDDAKGIMDAFEKRNEELKNGKWQDGWHEFCVSVQNGYIAAVQNYVDDSDERLKHHFAHYLDCEAHTDVWRELFKTWNYTNELDKNRKI